MRTNRYSRMKTSIYAVLCAVSITGCASTPIARKWPEPPASLLAVPAPLPPVPADLRRP
jgi:hypothetical protein